LYYTFAHFASVLVKFYVVPVTIDTKSPKNLLKPPLIREVADRRSDGRFLKLLEEPPVALTCASPLVKGAFL